MENQGALPPTDPQGHHIPPNAEHPGHAFQPNMPAYQQGEYPNCRCPQCSAMQRTQIGPPTGYPVEQQDQRHFGSAGVPYLNQGLNQGHENQGYDVGNRAEAGTIVPNGTRAVPQTAGIPDFGNAPVYDRAGPPDIELLRAPILDVSIAERRRRLAVRYLNNPDAYVSMIRLEPSASGQFQVVITLEMANVL